MPVIKNDSYQPGFIFRNGDINSIATALFRKPPLPSYERLRLRTLDEDFLDLDTVFNNNKRLAILCHGLEGSSRSQYILSLSSLLSENNFDVIAMNFRSCSGEINKQRRMYHSGETSDLNFIIDRYTDQYDEINLVGFSLGGNVVLKYVGEKYEQLNPKIKRAVAVSVPCDLSAGVQTLRKWRNRLYEHKFLSSLFEKVKLKHQQFPDLFNVSLLKKVKSVWDYDHYFTGPVHGFDGAEDYYAKSNCKQFLHQINIPSLILTATDDPFLPEECYPYSIAEQSNFLNLLVTRYGGHVGYATPGGGYFWSDRIIFDYLNNKPIHGSN